MTRTMERMIIPVWDYAKFLSILNNHYPHRLEDFIQSLSKNQFEAKTWLVERLLMEPICNKVNKEIYVLGSWYGTIIVPLLVDKIGNIKTIHLVDYDKETLELTKGVLFKDVYKGVQIKYIHKDINFDFDGVESDIIINTSCEHMYPMKDFDITGLCVFQSNTFKEETAHINTVDSLDEFVEQSGITNIHYKGEIPFHSLDDGNKRFMIIGTK